MRFSIILALFASALVLAAPLQDEVESNEVSQAEAFELLDQFASANQLTQDEALDLLEQYAEAQAMGQEAEFGRFLGSAIKGIGKIAAKVLPKVGEIALKAGKTLLKNGLDPVGTVADLATGGGAE